MAEKEFLCKLSPFYIVGAIFLIIPIIIQIVNYIKVRSTDNLWLINLFVTAIINLVVFNFVNYSIVISIISSISFYWLLTTTYIIATDIVGSDSSYFTHRLLWIFAFTAFLNMLVKILVALGEIQVEGLNFAYFVSEITRVFTGIVIFRCFIQIKLVFKNYSTLYAKGIWISWGILMIIVGVVRGLIFSLLTYNTFFGSFLTSNNVYRLNNIVDIFGVLAVMVTIGVLIGAIVFPKTILLSHSNLLNATKVHDMLVTPGNHRNFKTLRR